MTTIGIIDDREEDRKMIADTVMEGSEADGWSIIDIPPLRGLDQYPAWIGENKICALIIDELLDEVLIAGEAVDYKGHHLVDYIRARYHTLPIFVITAHATDAPLQDRFKDVEGIFDRQNYAKTYSKYVPRIIRSAQQYLTIFQDELKQLSVYANKAAVGEVITDQEHDHIEAIRLKLGVAYSIDSITDISGWISDATQLIDSIAQLRSEIEKKVAKKVIKKAGKKAGKNK